MHKSILSGRPVLRKALIGALCLGALGGAGFAVLAWHPEIAPISPPAPESFSDEAVARGGIVAAAGYCSLCHTRTDGRRGAPLAGDFAMETPFGTFYSSNITPDPETGIGTWSKEAFARAMRRGISRDGTYLYAVFPYNHFTKMTDGDISDLYAWLMSQPAVKQAPRVNSVPFPLDIRYLQAGWQLLFFRPGRYVPDPKKSDDWNRGAYLADGVSHCGACHTPHNALGAEIASETYDGAVVHDWIAPALNDNNPTPVPWTENELYAYLRTGAAPYHGVVAGPMAPVVHDFYSKLPNDDVRAVSIYFASLNLENKTLKNKNKNSGNESAKKSEIEDLAAYKQAMKASGHDMSGAFIPDSARRALNPEGAQFVGAGLRLTRVTCGACHANFTAAPAPGRPELALSSALWLPEPNNLFQIMLRGISASEGKPGLVMPSYYTSLSDKEMAEIAAYLRATRTTLPPWKNLVEKAAQIRASVVPPPLSGASSVAHAPNVPALQATPLKKDGK